MQIQYKRTLYIDIALNEDYIVSSLEYL